MYQILAGSAAVILFIYFFSSDKKNFDKIQSEKSMIVSIDSNVINMNVSYPIDFLENQKIGRNIKEDSVLASFIYSTM